MTGGRPGATGLTRPAAILFDWDNTLIDSWAAIHDAQNHTFAHFGMQLWTFEETRRRVRGSMRDSYPALFGERWQEAGVVFYARFEANHLETLTPLAGAEALLATLHAAGFYLGVVSNKKGDYLRKEACSLGWDRFFGRIVGAFDACEDKPSAAPVRLALADSGLAPSEPVWFVGDADIDMECAINAGCVGVLLRAEAPDVNEFTAHPPVIHVESCLALCNLLKTL
ncbi:MAG: HAD family hydrolase [Rhodospirillales bacterium]|nr:MAG: HAD family hydrolase [Rhodospirillales bacterium]